MTAPIDELTRADAAALWHAVSAFDDVVRAMKDMPQMADHLPAERNRLEQAKRALRKVQYQVREAKKARDKLEQLR